MSYSIYHPHGKFVFDFVQKHQKHFPIPFNDRTKMGALLAVSGKLKMWFRNPKDMRFALDAFDLLTTANEITWIEDGYPTVFIDSLSLAQAIRNFPISQATTVAPNPFPYPVISVAFPREFRLAGDRVEPFLMGDFTQLNAAARIPPVFSPFSNQIPELVPHLQSAYATSNGARDFILTFRMPGKKSRVAIEARYGNGQFTAYYVLTTYNNETFPNANVANPMGGELLKFYLSLREYVTAFPDALCIGLPNGSSSKKLSMAKGHIKNWTIGLPGSARNGSSPEYHFRRGHFRELRHPRYKRDILGSPKVVWVREATVGLRSQDVRTVTP